MMRIPAVVVALFVPVVAAADPDHFVTMDRQDGSSRAGVEVSKLFYDSGNGIGTTDISGLRFDLHGQYVTPNAIGVYVNVPIGHASGGGQSYTSFGDMEVGGIFIPQLTSSNVKLVLHGGITLPTQSKDQNNETASALTLYPRITDLYLVVPEGLSLRLGVSPIIKSGQVFFRADLGFDANLSAAQGTGDVKNIVHANVGVGLDLGVAAVMLESANVYVTGNNNTNGTFGDSWLNTGAISARFDGGSVYPYAAIVFGLDHDVHSIMNEAITVGLEGRLR